MVGKELKGIPANNYYEVADLINRLLYGFKLMSDFDPKSTIALVRMTNHFLSLVDYYRENKTIKLCEVLDEFSEPYREVGFDSSNHSFLNQHQMLASLWAYIVLPKESFYNDLPSTKLSQLSDKWGLASSNIDVDLQYLMRKLRNSLSHARFSVSETLCFSFKDGGGFYFEIDEKNLSKFVQALAYWVMTKDENLQGL